MSSATPSVGGRHAQPVGGDPECAVRRRAAVVAAIAGLAVPVWFWISEGLFGLVGPPDDAAAGDYIDFYVENFSQLPRIATAYVGLWALILVLFIAVVRAAVTRLNVAALVAVGLAVASAAAAAIVEGVRAWPTLTFETAAQLADTLDPVVAQALVDSRGGLHGPAVALSGIAMLVIAWLLVRSDLWGHTVLAVLTGLSGAATAVFMLFGPEGPALTVPWGIVVAVVLLVGLRLDRPSAPEVMSSRRTGSRRAGAMRRSRTRPRNEDRSTRAGTGP
jgi:hypothetical protein